MQEAKLDIMAPKEEQLKILIPYLEKAARQKKDKNHPLPATTQTKVLVNRYLWHWTPDLYSAEGLTPKGALMYYKRLIGEKSK